MSLITADDLTKTYRTEAIEVKALQGVSFAIQPGAFLAFVGPSGSGKTTLLNLIGCLDKPSSGSLQVAGVDVLKLGRRQAAEFRGQNIGFIFQFLNPFGGFHTGRSTKLSDTDSRVLSDVIHN